MEKGIVVIGAGSAGASACFCARKRDRKVPVTCINAEPYPTYSRCALPFVVGGEIESFDIPTVFDFDFYKSQKIEILPDTTVTSVDTSERIVKTDKEEFVYDSLILATGGTAKMPRIPGADLDGVFVLRTRADGAEILDRAKPGGNAVINGASFIALEAAEALKKRGMNVACVIRSRALRSMIDGQFSKIVEEKLVEKGIEVIKGDSVSEITGEGKVESVKAGDIKIEADLVVMCTGTAPETVLAEAMGVEIGKTGGIKVNEYLETSIPDVYAIGDCVESKCFIRETPVLSGLGTIATRQGMVAGANATGAREKAPPVLGASIMKLYEIEIGAVGLTEDFARDAGFDVATGAVKYPTLPHYYPGGEEAHVRLIAQSPGGRLLGGQVIVESRAAYMVNMMSIAILKGVTADELQMADFCYSPPCLDIWAAEAIAAGGLLRKLEKARK